MKACKDEDIDLVKKLLAQGEDVNAQDEKGRTALIYAAIAGAADCSRFLLSSGANAEIADDGGKTANDYHGYTSSDPTTMSLDAVVNGDSQALKTLLKEDDNPNIANGSGSALPPLVEAAQEGHVGVVKSLLEAGANTEAIDGRATLEYFYSVVPDQDTPDWVNKNYSNYRPWHGTALTYAADFGHAKIVKLLLDAGANKEAKDDLGRTPIFLAQQIDCCKELIAAGANVNARDHSGETPLFSAESADYVKALVHAGANPNAREPQAGNTPLSMQESPSVVKALLESGANVNERNNIGTTALDNNSPPGLEGTKNESADENTKEIIAMLKAAGGKHGRQLPRPKWATWGGGP